MIRSPTEERASDLGQEAAVGEELAEEAEEDGGHGGGHGVGAFVRNRTY